MKNKAKAIKIFLLSLLLAFLLLICPGFIRAYSMSLDFGLSHFAYIIVSWLLFKKYPEYKYLILTTFILTISGVFSIISYTAGHLQVFSLPNFSAMIAGVIVGYLSFIVSIRTKILIILVSLIVCVSYYLWGIDRWLSYCNHGTFTGEQYNPIDPTWSNLIDENELKDKGDNLIVLDIFNTHCSICFKEFPKFQRLYDRYKPDSSISFLAVDIPFKGDTDENIENILHNEKGYTFPLLKAKSGLDTLMQIKGYPTVFVIKNNTILFKGDLKYVQGIIEANLENRQ